MALYYSPLSLQNTLEQKGERLFKRKGEVLFRRGERAGLMFVVLSGKVRLDFGVDSPLSRCYGPSALVGLPATLTRRSYRMNATVIEDAELSVWRFTALDSLLRKRRDFCQQMLTILGEKMAESQAMAKALAYKEGQPSQASYVA
jgi:CRP-like cAMP-binding protein